MPNTRQRQIALLAIAALTVVALLAPSLGRAQEATPAAAPPEEAELVAMGETLYNETCIACHQAGGEGAESEVALTRYPALAGNPLVTFEDPTVLVDTLLWGRAGMPAFRGWSDEEIAAVSSYVRQAWGNQAAPVSPEFVAERRALRDVEAPAPATPFSTPLPGADGTSGAGTPVAEETVVDPELPQEQDGDDTPEAAPTQGQ